MKKSLIAGAAIVFSLSTFAQTNFQQGYVVTANGDTLKGRIDNQLWRESPKRITFTDVNGTFTYQPKDLISFGAGEHTFYRSFKVSIDTTGGTGGDRSVSISPTFLEEHVLLQVIVDSQYSLLKYVHGFRTHFFIHEQGSIPEELIRHESERRIAGQILVQPGNQFIAQLTNRMGDCPTLRIDPKMQFSEKSLTKLFVRYNECRSNEAKVPGNEQNKISFGPVIAVHRDAFTNGQDGGIGYNGGVFLQVTYPKGVYKTSWYNELVYFKYGEQTTNTSQVNIGAVKFTTLVKSRIIYNSMSPYILGGLSHVFPSPGGKLVENTTKITSNVNAHWGLVAGFGLYATRSLSVDLRVERTSPIILVQSKSRYGISGLGQGSCWSVGINLAYNLNKK